MSHRALTSAARFFDTFVCPAVPARRLAAARILVGTFALVYLLARFVALWRLSSLPEPSLAPVGVISLASEPLSAPVYRAILIATTLLAIPFLLGRYYRVVAPAFALGLLVVLSYRNSWGMIFHTENLLALHVAILALSPAADAYSLDAMHRTSTRELSWHYGWPLFLMSLVTVSAYALAGFAKLRYGGLEWANGDVLRNHVAMDNARKLLLGDSYSPFASPAMKLDKSFAVLATGSLFLELVAPLALFHKSLARYWVISVVGFHAGVVILMAIVFPYPLCGVAFVSFFASEKLIESARARWHRKTKP